MGIRAENHSLGKYLRHTLNHGTNSRMAFVSFNQWTFTTAAIMNTAVAAQAEGIQVEICLWADFTPLQDFGWTSSRHISRLCGSKTLYQSVRIALEKEGFESDSFITPPLSSSEIRAIPVIPTPLPRKNMRRSTFLGSPMGRSILQVHPNYNTPIRNDYVCPARWVKVAMKSYAWVFDQTQELIRHDSLSAIVVFNGRSMHDQAAAAAAQSMGIQVLYYDTGGLETSFDLTGASTNDWSHLQDPVIDLYQWFSDPYTTEFDPTAQNTVNEIVPALQVHNEQTQSGCGNN